MQRTDILSAFFIAFCIIGSYALRNSYFDIYVALAFGLLGYWMRKDGFSLGPITLSLVLGTMIEQKLVGALKIAEGNFLVFFTRPISLALFLLATLVIVLSIVSLVKQRRRSSPNKSQGDIT